MTALFTFYFTAKSSALCGTNITEGGIHFTSTEKQVHTQTRVFMTRTSQAETFKCTNMHTHKCTDRYTSTNVHTRCMHAGIQTDTLAHPIDCRLAKCVVPCPSSSAPCRQASDGVTLAVELLRLPGTQTGTSPLRRVTAHSHRALP